MDATASPTHEECVDLTRRQARQLDAPRAEVERLKAELKRSRRAGKRQAAPFSTGSPKADLKRPGRKAGHPPNHRPVPPPDQVHHAIEVPPPPGRPECRAPLGEARALWRRVASHAVGGLTEVGFAGRSDLLLVVSSRGRGLFEGWSGEFAARDPAPPDDGWAITRIAPDWPLESIVLDPPGSSGPHEGHDRGRARIAEGFEMRAYGFSETGLSLVVASLDHVKLWRRPDRSKPR